MIKYTFQRGETISLALDAVTGDPLVVTGISAAMKAAAPGRTGVAPDAPVAAVFDIAMRTADGETPGGWNLTIPAVQSSNLAPGNYLADAKLTVAGGVIIADPIGICIKAGVT